MLDSDSDDYNCKSIIKTSMILNNAWIINFACFEHFFYVRHIENLKPFSQIVFPQTTLVKSLYIIRKRNCLYFEQFDINFVFFKI